MTSDPKEFGTVTELLLTKPVYLSLPVPTPPSTPRIKMLPGYKEMLELLVSASLTVNSDRPGKLKPSRADADVWTLSDREGRPPAVCFSGPGGGSVQPTEHGRVGVKEAEES
ncbi:hypothetical protein E5288_WYG013159 [Bos mutus]|uniref:Uncharacterized protein n=1 Tax=Bos mutus TaxID=72004 RepID=A0A6B0R9Y0_9CETA|nr:hypothetical protein [Bos mutus]